MTTRDWLRARLLGLAAVLTLASSLFALPSPGWSTQTVDSAGSVGFFNSIAYSPVTGFPAIAYSDESNGGVKLATWNGASWGIQTVDAARGTFEGISLAFDPAGNPAISYCAGGLKFARWTGATWTIQTIDSGGGGVTSLVFKAGQPSVAYVYSAK